MKTALAQTPVVCLAAAVLLTAPGLAADEPDVEAPAVKARSTEMPRTETLATGLSQSVPFGQSPVDYWGPETRDAVARLNRTLRRNDARLEYDGRWGYLTAVLRELQIPPESQILVFSKTALNRGRVGPATPRALYFNDNCAVGWVPEAGALEVMAMDPGKGAVFYTLEQQRELPPQFRRSRQCLACHAATATLHVPGWMWRSFVTDVRGEPLTGFSRISHQSAFAERWGGTYVTGQHGTMPHRGNVIGRDAIASIQDNPLTFGNMRALPDHVLREAYPSPHSDIVAHLVLDHQVQGLNLIIRANLESQLGQASDSEELLFRYLLFFDSPPLPSPVTSESGYRQAFEKMGPQDGQGRSLRTLDLQQRVLQWRLSYLVYSDAFAGLPQDVQKRLGRRLRAHLLQPDGMDGPHAAGERQTILEILAATREHLPDVFAAQVLGDRP